MSKEPAVIVHPLYNADDDVIMTRDALQNWCWHVQVDTRLTCTAHPLPAPGTLEAARLRCTCPVTVNAAGRDELLVTKPPDGGGIDYIVRPTQVRVKKSCLVHGDPPPDKLQRRRSWWRFWRR